MTTAYVFPGQGAQHIGMGVDLARSSAAAADTFARASEAIGVDLLDLCRHGPEATLTETDLAQPALLTVGVASCLAVREKWPAPSYVAGLSLGEYTALAAVGAFTLADAVALVHERGRLMKAATRDRDVAMAAVIGLDMPTVAGLCSSVRHVGLCEAAVHNAPRQVVVSGDRRAVALLAELAERGDAWVTWLKVSSAFHTSLMTPLRPQLARLLAATPVARPAVPVVANVSVRPTDDPSVIRDCLVRQLDSPVRWTETMARLAELGVDTLVEMAPCGQLTRLAKATDRRLATVRVDRPTSNPASVRGAPTVPAARADAYRRLGYWRGETLCQAVLGAAAQQPPDRVALVDARPGTGHPVRYGELPALVGRLATHLHRIGIGHADRVVVQLVNGPAFVLLLLALWRLGAVAVLALPSYGERELRHTVRTSGAVALAVSRRRSRVDALATERRLVDELPSLTTLLVHGSGGEIQAGEIDIDVLVRTPAPDVALPPEPVGADLALLLQSGGTTGLPKLIPRTHDDYRYNIGISADICRFDRDTVYLAALPVAHNFALGCPGVLGVLYRGGRAVFSASPRPRALLAAMAEHAVTATAVVPGLATQLADVARERGHPPRDLRLIQVGGARLHAHAARHVRAALDCTVQQVYGMAEGLLNFTRLDDPDDVVDNTQGRPASPGDEIRVVDEAGDEVADGAVGELLVRGPYTIAGYFRADEHNARAFDDSGFFHSGDLVRWTPGGNLVVEGRSADLINRSGEKISAAAVESLLSEHPFVRHVAVVAAPDGATGESVCAFVALRHGGTLAITELRSFLLARGLARYALPERLELLDDLPVTALGKPDKAALRTLAAQVSS